MDLNKDYFLMLNNTHLTPESLGLQPAGKDFINAKTGEKYYFAWLYDSGWGPTKGYVLDRKYKFNDLIQLALQKGKSEHNNFGAIEVIMSGTTKQKHFREEFINFVMKTILEDNYDEITDYFQYFVYSICVDSKTNNLYLRPVNYYVEELLRKNTNWREIETEVYERLLAKGLFNKWNEELKIRNEDVRGRIDEYPV